MATEDNTVNDPTREALLAEFAEERSVVDHPSAYHRGDVQTARTAISALNRVLDVLGAVGGGTTVNDPTRDAIAEERLCDDTGHAIDLAYNQAIDDALAAYDRVVTARPVLPTAPPIGTRVSTEGIAEWSKQVHDAHPEEDDDLVVPTTQSDDHLLYQPLKRERVIELVHEYCPSFVFAEIAYSIERWHDRRVELEAELAGRVEQQQPTDAQVEAGARGRFEAREAELAESYERMGQPWSKVSWEDCDQTSREIYLKDSRWTLVAALGTTHPTERWTPVDKVAAAEFIGEGLHTGLRKGSEADDATALWGAISRSTAWADALDYLMWGLGEMGMALCRRAPADQEDTDA